MKKLLYILLLLPSLVMGQKVRLNQLPAIGNNKVYGTNSSGVAVGIDISSLGSGTPSWSSITSKPTTLSGYGITDPIVLTSGTYSNPAWITSLAWSKLSGVPTSLSGYGITDPIVLTSGSYSNPSWITSLAFSKLSGVPTSQSGYGIVAASGDYPAFYPLLSGSYANPAWITSLAYSKITGAPSLSTVATTGAFSDLSGKPTTLSGYGITDAVPNTRTITINGTTLDLSANRSWTITAGDTTYPYSKSATNSLIATRLPIAGGSITGTGGNGYIGFPVQSSAPSAPGAGVRLYAGSTGALSWIGVNGFTRSFSAAGLTGNRIYKLQNADMTLADSSVVATNTANIATNTSNIALKADKRLTVNTQTADYTLVLGDEQKVVDMNKATAINLTVPPNSSVAFPVGTTIYVRRIGAGALTLVQGVGVTITATAGVLTDAGQNVMMTLRKTGTDTWDLQNGVSPTSSTFTPTFTGFSADPTGATIHYMLIGKLCILHMYPTAGTSNATTMTITLPFAPAYNSIFNLPVVNAGAQQTGRMAFTGGSNVATLWATAAAGAFTSSGSKNVYFSGIAYEIQ